jgi:hypothetical protein
MIDGLEKSNYYVEYVWQVHEGNSYTNIEKKTRGSQELVIAHLVFNLTSKFDRKWGCYT